MTTPLDVSVTATDVSPESMAQSLVVLPAFELIAHRSVDVVSVCHSPPPAVAPFARLENVQGVLLHPSAKCETEPLMV
jgi:hypothetical protein